MRSATLCLVLSCALAAPAWAQSASDVTGVSTTGSTIAGGVFTPPPSGTGAGGAPAGGGAVPTGAVVPPQVMQAVVATSGVVSTQLSAGTMTTPAGAPISAPAQQVVATVMTTGTPAAQAQLAAALTQAGSTPAVAEAVTSLVNSLPGLLVTPTPAQLTSALSAFNALVNNAGADFLQNPPPEFQAIHSALRALVAAGNAAAQPR